jgi:hypothetical protein
MRKLIQKILGAEESRRRQLFHKALGPNGSVQRRAVEHLMGRGPGPNPSPTLAALMEIRLDEHSGLDIDSLPIAGKNRPLDDRHGYWARRKNDRLYYMTVLYAHLFSLRKHSIADIGCHCSPLVLMVPGFKRRFAVDPSPESRPLWKDVDGAVYINDMLENVDIPAVTGGQKVFDLIICNQVIEHLDDPASFAAMLLSKCNRLIISTTFETPAGLIRGHVQDPISLEKFESWFPRRMICCFISRGSVSGKIVAVF